MGEAGSNIKNIYIVQTINTKYLKLGNVRRPWPERGADPGCQGVPVRVHSVGFVCAVEAGFPSCDGHVLCEVHLRAGAGGAEDGGVVPVERVAVVAGVLRRCGLDVPSIVHQVVEAVSTFVFPNASDRSSEGLADVGGVARDRGTLLEVDVVGWSSVCRRSGLRFAEEVAECGSR